MNEAACIVGLDVAKLKLDIALLNHGKFKSKVIDNTPAGFRELAKNERPPGFAGEAAIV